MMETRDPQNDPPPPAEAVVAPPARAALAPVPDGAEVARAILPWARRRGVALRLRALLAHLDPDADVMDVEVRMIRLSSWIRRGPAVPPNPADPSPEPQATRRLRLLVAAVEAFPACRERLSRALYRLLSTFSAEGLFARMGIPGDRGLLAETSDRLARRLLPQPLDEQDITELCARLFPRRGDPTWIASLPADLLLRFVRGVARPALDPDEPALSQRPSLLDTPLGAVSIRGDHLAPSASVPTTSAWAPLRPALLDAILLLSSRVAAAGVSDDIRARGPTRRLRESPFFRLSRSIDALLATPRSDVEAADAFAEECRILVQQCRDASRFVLEHLEEKGVSVDVVYRLELIDRSLSRIELLLGVLVQRTPDERVRRAAALLATLLEERQRDLSLLDMLRTNTRLLARKVIERTGETGEHYITATRGEYVGMLVSAAGGGVLTGGTTALKFLIGHLHRPLLQEGLLAGMNYAGSFLLMQALGCTLATKQPSMTAAALAGSIKEGGDFSELVTLVARVIRSQLAAAAGNVVLVIPSAAAIAIAAHHLFGARLIDAEYAHHVIQSFHPTQSGTIAFAALTGVILWLSSLVAGFVENWAAYHRLPEAIAEHRIRRLVGGRITQLVARVFARNISGIGGNVSVGFMLGLTGVVGQFVGMPLEVRHVTLSTGQLTVAVETLGLTALSTPEFQLAVLGIVLILVMNLVVSFSCAIVVALRAREVSLRDALRLPLAVLVGFVKNPLRFLLPLGDTGPTPPHP